jgi:2-C-methyl-D-erythritol 2,4-cyclodiphosphate synthase
MRIGNGYDVHRLAEGRKLMIGGVDIPFEKGLFGHSDADVLLHAICDAMLGAAGLGDIGRHFPDSAPMYKDISSLTLLDEVRRLLAEAGFRVNNVDATIVAEKPKMAPHIPAMVTNIAAAIKVDRSAVNVKATTTEGLGFAGRGEGMAAYAVASIRKVE